MTCQTLTLVTETLRGVHTERNECAQCDNRGMTRNAKEHHCHAVRSPLALPYRALHCHADHNLVILNEVKNLVAPSRSETTLHHNDREGMIMLINKMTQPSVGADLSRTPPIYRPSMDSRMSTLNSQYAQTRTSNLPVPSSSFISSGSLNNVSYF